VGLLAKVGVLRQEFVEDAETLWGRGRGGARTDRRLKPGSSKRFVYTWPPRRSLTSETGKVWKLTHRNKHRTLTYLLRQVNPVLRGRCNYAADSGRNNRRLHSLLDHAPPEEFEAVYYARIATSQPVMSRS
jgi:transposase InsO family protein